MYNVPNSDRNPGAYSQFTTVIELPSVSGNTEIVLRLMETEKGPVFGKEFSMTVNVLPNPDLTEPPSFLERVAEESKKGAAQQPPPSMPASQPA